MKTTWLVTSVLPLLVISAEGQEPVARDMEASTKPIGAEVHPTQRVVLEGVLVMPDQSPAEGAVVVSSAGGQAVTDVGGLFSLEVSVPLEAESLQVTAVGRAGGNLVASTCVALPPSGSMWVGRLELSQGTSCSPSWLPTFGGQPGTNGTVLALAVYDDGGGPELYVGGGFTSVGGVAANSIAKWDGSSWAALGSGMNNAVRALSVYDDGGGPALYAAGNFTIAGSVAANRIARWDGSSWSPLGSGLNSTVYDLAVYDDGGGPALYAGGSSFFGTPGSVARWDGSTWSAVGSGMDSAVYALAVYDDGGGPALYAAGPFYSAGGVAAGRIAKWNGSSWAALLGGGVGCCSIDALVVHDDGGGPALYAAGDFTIAGGVGANHIAKWNGSSWSALGSGISGNVHALAVYDDGSGPALYAGWGLTFAPGPNHIAKWNGSSWSALGSGISDGVDALAVYDDGSGPALYAGGGFTSAGGVAAIDIAKWDGSSWSALGSGINNFVFAVAVHDDGGGPALYAGGRFTSAGGVAANRIAKWNGSSWSALGSGMRVPNPALLDPSVSALAVYDDGGGSALYAGGGFTIAGGVAANRIAKWNGSSWSALGSGMSGDTRVSDLAVYDDGSGPALYAGGDFTSAGGVAANRIAKWNGSSWSALGSGTNGDVGALAVYDDGGGPALYAGGSFTSAGGVAANRIAKWNGSSWSALGSGTNGDVGALAVYDDGGGPALYAGGSFTSAGGVAANRIARWNGSSWSALGSGMSGGSTSVSTLAVYDDGGGPALYAGGNFTNAGGMTANRIARWDGSSWSALGSGMDNQVLALTVFDDGGGPALYAGGAFSIAYDSADSYLAKWGCFDTTPPVLSCPEAILVMDGFPNGPGEAVQFSVTASDDSDPSPTVMCTPPSGTTFPPGTTIVQCTATDASGNQSSCQFPVTVQPKARRR